MRDANVAIRDYLADLILADDRGEPRGMSKAKLARAFGVSKAQLARVLRGDRYLSPGRIARAPEPLYRACMAFIAEARGERTAAHRAPASRGRQLAALVGELNAKIDRAEADGVIDAGEFASIRVQLGEIVRAGEDGLGDFDARGVTQ